MFDPIKGTCNENFQCFVLPEGGHSCECLTGYYQSGSTCTDTNECEDENACVAGAACTNIPHSFLCHCKTGYLDVNGDASECQDIDECYHGQVCPDMEFGFLFLKYF